MSAAGQHDTYLNVRGEAAVVDAVRRCWASLWSARAIGYRARRGISPGDVSIAVVVQRLVPAEAAGVMFDRSTRSSGAPDQVVVSANWGLGESAAPATSPRTSPVVDRPTEAPASDQPGGEQIMTVADGAGTLDTERPAPALTPALSPGQAAELARVGLAIEKPYGEPVDVEWARADSELWVVQARPVTTCAARPPLPF